MDSTKIAVVEFKNKNLISLIMFTAAPDENLTYYSEIRNQTKSIFTFLFNAFAILLTVAILGSLSPFSILDITDCLIPCLLYTSPSPRD